MPEYENLNQLQGGSSPDNEPRVVTKQVTFENLQNVQNVMQEEPPDSMADGLSTVSGGQPASVAPMSLFDKSDTPIPDGLGLGPEIEEMAKETKKAKENDMPKETKTAEENGTPKKSKTSEENGTPKKSKTSEENGAPKKTKTAEENGTKESAKEKTKSEGTAKEILQKSESDDVGENEVKEAVIAVDKESTKKNEKAVEDMEVGDKNSDSKETKRLTKNGKILVAITGIFLLVFAAGALFLILMYIKVITL